MAASLAGVFLTLASSSNSTLLLAHIGNISGTLVVPMWWGARYSVRLSLRPIGFSAQSCYIWISGLCAVVGTV